MEPDGRPKSLQNMTRWTANPIERFGKGIPDNLDAGCQWKNGTIQNLCTSDTVKPRL